MALVSKILCPTDFSPSAAAAVDYAVALAKVFSASIQLIHVVQPTAYPMHNLATVAGFPNLRDELRKAVDRELEVARQRAGKEVAITVAVREGIPHEQIIEAVTHYGCDLTVMATHGHTGLKHALLGSTAERVVRGSPRPVLTVRGASQ